ncbi:MAG: permease prefix domain 1-containing protein [Clostridia bacterium]|nr:permease prefix domain 1-containing protein [Clostridia bacterium]
MTKDIRSRSERASVALEYENHIRDAMLHSMLNGIKEEDAFRSACEDLGDIEELAVLLGDVHNQDKIPDDIRRETLLRRGILCVVCAIIFGLLLWAWGLFVLQAASIVIGIILAVRLCILCSAFSKRRRAIKAIRRYAKQYGSQMLSNRTVYSSILYPSDIPSVILENDTQYIKVRFLTTLQKKHVLHFLGRNVYLVSHTHGGALLAITPLAPGWSLFHPRNTAPLNRSGIVTMTADYPENAIALPTLERRHDPIEKEIHEVLILNPAPMRAFYREGTTEVELLGGEQKDGVWLHDIISFGSMLEKLKEETV